MLLVVPVLGGLGCAQALARSAQENRFADFIVHEAAHVFHNCKRRTAGLPETQTRERLLDIEFRKGETFAYACEAYSRILVGRRPSDRRSLLQEPEAEGLPGDDSVSSEELLDILRGAVEVRNGWKRILGHGREGRGRGRR